MEDRQTLNRNLAQMLKGGVIMDVTTPEQARIAEAAGAWCSRKRVPARWRWRGDFPVDPHRQPSAPWPKGKQLQFLIVADDGIP